MPITTNENKNRLGELLGVNANTPKGLRQGIATSQLSYRNSRLADIAQGRKTFVTAFGEGVLPAGLIYTSESGGSAGYTTGQAVLTTSALAAKSLTLDTGLPWKTNRQATGEPLVFECRVQPGATITSMEYWVGLTDAGAEAVDTAIYAIAADSTFTTSVPTDGVFLGFSTTPSSGAGYLAAGNQHLAIATKADTDTLVAAGGGSVAASTWYNYRIELDANGTARYYVNDVLLATQATALTITVALAAVVTVIPRTTAARILTVDYIHASGDGPTTSP